MVVTFATPFSFEESAEKLVKIHRFWSCQLLWDSCPITFTKLLGVENQMRECDVHVSNALCILEKFGASPAPPVVTFATPFSFEESAEKLVKIHRFWSCQLLWDSCPITFTKLLGVENQMRECDVHIYIYILYKTSKPSVLLYHTSVTESFGE